MEKKTLVSIIVPIYNAQEHLNRCIASLINQTYSNLEIILINDGSQDSSRKICEDYAKNDPRIKVIHQCNKGAAEAKNSGLNLFNGEYVSFVDSDDFVKENYIEKLLDLSVGHQADLVQAMYQIGADDCFDLKSSKEFKIKIFNDNSIFKSNFYKSIVCGKLYKRELFDDVRFIPNRVIDDEGVSYKNYYLANKTVLTTEQLYYYYQSANSAMRNDKKTSLDFMDTFEERLTYFKNQNEIQLYDLSLGKYCQILMLKYMTVYSNPLNSMDDSRRIMDRFNEIFPNVIKSRHNNLRDKVMFCFFKFFPRISLAVRKKVRI